MSRVFPQHHGGYHVHRVLVFHDPEHGACARPRQKRRGACKSRGVADSAGVRAVVFAERWGKVKKRGLTPSFKYLRNGVRPRVLIFADMS